MSAERNWLLRHASAVLYPTSAEGFGLIPFEAARFGTPTIEVAFGPLVEATPDLPVAAADWSPEALAEATENVLGDPRAASANVEATLRSGAAFNWGRTAAALADVYRDVLSRPRRIGP
jgi:glycosyltransferase involved in cell wall biosynthesis